MTNESTGSATGLRGLRSLPDSDRLSPDASTPHLATGFFLMAVVIASAVFIAGTMDSQVRLAGVATVAIVVSMIIFWMIVAQPTLGVLEAARSQGELERARTKSIEYDVHHATAQKEQTAGRVGRLGGILASTQKELANEIAGLGAVVNELAENSNASGTSSELVDRLKQGVDLVEESQRNVSAISRLGTSNRTDRIVAFRASGITPIPVDATVVVDRDDEIYGDVDLWRLFVKNAVRNAELHGKASSFTVSTGGGRLTLSDDGSGCATELLERAWRTGLRPNGTRSNGMQIMRRIAEVHDGAVNLHGEPHRGVRIDVDLRDLEIDLRSRQGVGRPIRTPYKASGGRTTTIR